MEVQSSHARMKFKLTAKQKLDLVRKQKGSAIPSAPKSHLTDDVVSFLQTCYEKQKLSGFAESLAKLLQEPKVYLMRALVTTF